jgi:serine/threonine-protein kinase
VFEVEHAQIGRRAAMKIVHPDAMLPGLVNRLFVEAKAVNVINHPNVVAVTDILVPDGQQPHHALVMELLDGKSLADVIANGEPLEPPRFLPIVAQVCDGLAAVHRAGFVHRDVKPENVFLIERDGNPEFVKLLDFGLVKAIRSDIRSGRATVQGTFLGSPAYASPEQAAGKPVDFRTDIYAVGILLHELATGRLPFQAESIADLLAQQITAAPPRLPVEMLATDVGRALDAIIQACLMKEPHERVLTAAHLADMFRQLAAGQRLAPARVRRRLAIRGRRRLFAVVPAVALVAIGFFVAYQRWAPARSLPSINASAPTVAPLVPAAASASTLAVERSPASESPSVEGDPGSKTPVISKRRGRVAAQLSKAITLDPYR